MTYRYRVTLTGIKGFFRVYHIDAKDTLYSLHKQMRSDMEFPQDQLILFKALDENGSVLARYGLFDLGSGAADQITLAQTVGAGVTSFVYFYDVTDKKSVNITFEGEVEGSCSTPVLVESKGPDPIEFEHGYVAFEDLAEEQRRRPEEGEKKKSKLEELLGIDLSKDLDEDDDEDEDFDNEDGDEEEDDDEEEEKICEEGVEIFDGSEDLTL